MFRSEKLYFRSSGLILRIIRGRWEWEKVEHVRAGYKTRMVVTHVAIATS